MIQDMHLHSNYSDGQDSLEEMIRCAISLGINKICFTDHVWKTSEWIDQYIDEINSLKIMYASNIEVICGVETKLLNFTGELDIPDEIYGRDIRIVAAMHRIPLGDNKFIRRSEISNDLDISKKTWMKAFKSYKYNKNINCIAHPFSLLEVMQISKYDYDWWHEISNALEQTNAKIEYNVKYDNSIVPDWFWEKHYEKIITASDSHSTEDLIQRYKILSNLNTKIMKKK